MQKVAVVKVDSFDYTYEDVEKGVQEALDLLGGIDNFISPGERVLLKPNMVEGVDKGTCVTTHPEVVRAVIRQVLCGNVNRSGTSGKASTLHCGRYCWYGGNGPRNGVSKQAGVVVAVVLSTVRRKQ